MLNNLKYIKLFGPNFSLGIKHVFLFVFYLFLVCSLAAQENLVPNPSFEEYWNCPTNPGAVGDNQLERCKNWYKPSLATSDYYNACQTDISSGVNVPINWFGYQKAFHGNAYVGIDVYIEEDSKGAEYLQCKLNHPLESCKSYKVRFWASLGDFCSRATPTLGLRIDTCAILQSNALAFMGFELPAHISTQYCITDTSTWTLIEGIYSANGGEQYLTIGRFLDTTIYSNNNVPNITVHCDSCFSDIYGENTAHYYIDSVSVIELKENVIEKAFPNILSDNRDGINDYWYPFGACSIDWTCTILNRWGNVVYEFNQDDVAWSGKDQNDQELSEGIYYYIFKGDKETKTGFIQLVR